MKFLHCADLHLDSPLLGLNRYEGAPVGELRGATRRSLHELVQLALRENVGLVLIAGDLFDGDWPDFNTGLYFVGQMARLRAAGIRVALVRGNHDAESRLTKSLPLPDHIHVFPSQAPETRIYEDLGVAVHGQSFGNRTVDDDLAAGYPRAIPGAFNIGLLHTSLDGRPGHAAYAPTRLDVLRGKGYDYWALGHVHRRELVREDEPRVVFPGNPQGRHARETGAKGCELVTVEEGRMQTRFVALDCVRWLHLECPVGDLANSDDLLEVVQKHLRAAAYQAEGRLLAVRLRITGQGPLHGRIAARRDAIENELRAVALDLGPSTAWIEKIQFELRPTFDRSQGVTRPDALSEVLWLIENLRAEPEELRLLAKEACSDLTTSLISKLPAEVRAEADFPAMDDPKMLERLLVDAEGLLLARLLEGA